MRFGGSILNYAVTSNHIHLLVKDGQEREVIPETIQLVAGRTGQEYNQRKNRKGLLGRSLSCYRGGSGFSFNPMHDLQGFEHGTGGGGEPSFRVAIQWLY